MPGGKVLIYRGDQQVGELTAEAPFPDGALLACDGDCAVRMDSLMLVGADKSIFSVTTQASSRELQVREGTVYFAMSKMPRSLLFITPNWVVTVQRLILNTAANQELLKGYVTVTGKSSEIGVIEGGSMLVSTVAGEKTIQSGNKIILGQTDQGQTSAEQTEQPAETPPGGTGGGVAVAPIAAGAIAVGVATVAAVNAGGGGGGGGDDTSPASP